MSDKTKIIVNSKDFYKFLRPYKATNKIKELYHIPINITNRIFSVAHRSSIAVECNNIYYDGEVSLKSILMLKEVLKLIEEQPVVICFSSRHLNIDSIEL